MKRLILILLFPATLFAFGVRLTWSPNTESDLAGYNIYSGLECFSDTVSIQDTTYLFELHDFSPDSLYWFAVSAIDTAGNESEFSKVVRIHRCDFNFDGVIDGRDNFLINRTFGSVLGGELYESKYDLNNDFVIDFRDKFVFLKYFGVSYE